MARASPSLRSAVFLTVVLATGSGGLGEELVTGQLAIRGAVLTVSPEHQEVAPGLPTVVQTTLGQLEPGQIPPGLRVEGDLAGPGLDQPLALTTAPGDVFRIPGLNREGTYTLSNIRLVDDGRTVSPAVPDSVEIFVHRLVISSITSRQLTPEEMDAYGIVIDADNYTAWHYSVGFQIEGGTVEVPFDIMLGPQGMTLLEAPQSYALPVPSPDLPEVPVPTVNSGSLGPPQQELPSIETPDLQVLEETPIPGFIIIPTDIAFLNQFFSVIMVVQNGALAGSGLELRDLTGILELEGDGLRQAETDPPTIPGEAVPVLDPGPDGEPGTSDDLIFIVAQASGQATWLVEGLREGHHRLTAHLTGQIHGLASGKPAPIEGRIPGVVVVRDPRFALTFFHPNTVRTGEHYDFRVSVTNVSTTPVYDLSLKLPANAISGVRLVGPDEDPFDDIEDGDNLPVQGIPELKPGDTGMVTWRLESRKTGRVVASAFNTSSPLDASFVFEIGIGELGIPLSPESIVLPPEVDDLPQAVVEPALELLGLAHSLANAPNGVEVDLPPVGETVVMLRGTELAAAGQRHAFGEPLERSVMSLALEWMGVTHWSTSFDVLRRRSRRGHELESATAFYLEDRTENVGAIDAFAELEELAISGRPALLVFAEGAGFEGDARLSLVGNTSGKHSIGRWSDIDLFSRELEGASILELDSAAWSGEVGIISVPIEEDGSWFEGGYQVQLWGIADGSVDLEVVLVMPDGGTHRFIPSISVATSGRSLAFLDVGPEMDTTRIWSDIDGNTIPDWDEEIPVAIQSAPPATVITASFDPIVNPVRAGPYRNIVLLVSRPIDDEALAEIEVGEWLTDSELEVATAQGGTEIVDRDRHGRSFRLQLDPRILVATFEEPFNPHADLRLSSGISPLPLVGGDSLDILDQPVSIVPGLESGVVRGVVLGPDGRPLANAIVELYEQVEICHGIDGCNWYTNLSDRVRSDVSGAFLFDAVRFRTDHIPSQQDAFTVRAIDPETGHEARLVARLEADNDLRVLTLAMIGRGDVVGTLRRVDGEPLEDPIVIGRSITDPSEGAQAVPDESGDFRLEDLPVGPIQVVAVDGEAYTSATTQISAPGAEATVDLVLQVFDQPLASVEGSVIDGETAEPVSGLDVYVIPGGFSGPTHVATTNAEGLFAMAGIPPGVARFKAWSPALGRYVGEIVAELYGDATTNVEMILQPGSIGTITGTVSLVSAGSEAPLAGAYVVAQNRGVFTITDDQGHYELSNLTLGRIELETWDPETAAATSRSVDLTADGQVLVIDFTLREDQGLGSVTVNVADPTGSPEVGAEVAIGWFGSRYSGFTVGGGSVRIEEVPPGEHDVLVRSAGRLAKSRVKVLYPGHSAQSYITLGGLRDATIRVVGETTGDGTSVPLTPISYRVPGVRSNGTIGQVPVDGWTNCELEDDHSCRVENIPTNVGSLIAVATSGFYGSVSASKFIDDSGDHELTINFEALGVLGGRIVRSGPDGVERIDGAIVELWVRVTTGIVPQAQYTTLSDGVFQFDLVPRGDYSLRAFHPSFGVQWINGWMSAGQVVDDLELVLRGRAAIEGEVALCFDKKNFKAGSHVRVNLYPVGVPRPFISDLEINDYANGVLDLTLGEDDRASFMFADRMVGSWTLTATSALHGSAYEPTYIGPPGETASLKEPMCLHPTGNISGSVTFPETGEPASSVTVQLFRRESIGFSYLTTESTGEDGSYAFTDIPVGRDYQVRAFDTASNRGGSSAVARLCDASESGYGSTCSPEAVLNVSLSPMGRLEGALHDQDELPVASAHVRLRTSVVLNQNGTVQSHQREWTTFTGADGSFVFEGVPAGTALVTAYDPASPLYVEESISIDPVSSPTTTINLELPPTAEVLVRVLDPFGAELVGGNPVVAFRQDSQDYFREPSGSSPRIEHLATNANPSFDGVIANRYTVGACAEGCSSAGVEAILKHQFTTALGAVAERWMSNPPEDQVVELELAGRATVAVAVTQGGDPVADAVVRITGNGFYGTKDVSTQTVEDGSIIPIGGLGIGSYAVTASWSGLGGSREFEITQADHGSTIDLTISIEESGSADGRVLDPAGEPAEGALITMSFDGRTFQTVSDADGNFVFSVLNANETYRIEAYAANGLGRHTLHNVFVGSDVVHLGDLVLDETNPWVAAVSPSNGAQDADVAADVVIDFSESMRYVSLTGARIKLREQASGDVIPTSRSIEEIPDPDGEGPLGPFTRVTLTHGPLDSEVLYLVDVVKTVEDLAGRRPAFDFHSTFRTRDTVPPTVLAVDPADDPAGLSPVGPDAIVMVSFSEPMDEETVTAENARLIDAAGQPVEVVVDLVREGFDLRIRPVSALALDSFYNVEIDGVTDEAGLALVEPWSSTFRVRDIEPPAATLLEPIGAIVDGDAWAVLEGRPLTLRAGVTSNDAIETVLFTFGELSTVGQLDVSGEYRAEVVAPLSMADVLLTVQAEDVSGNLSHAVSHLIGVIDDDPPTGWLSADPSTEVLPNHHLYLSANIHDDHGLQTATITTTGAVEREWTSYPSVQNVIIREQFRVPADAVAGSEIIVSCEVVDNVGQRVELDPISVLVGADSAQPSIVTDQPAPGASFRAGQVVEFRFLLEDQVAVSSTSFEIEGEPVPLSLESVSLPGTSWDWSAEATAEWTVPEIDESVEFAWVMTATDPAGNSNSVNGVIAASPALGPEDPLVTFVCPRSGDGFVPSMDMLFHFEIEDDDQIQHFSMWIDGVQVVTEEPVDSIAYTGWYDWITPDAQPGDTVTILVSARDYAGNTGEAQMTLVCLGGTVLRDSQEITSDYAGEDLVLAYGEFAVTSPLRPASLTVLKGATLTAFEPDIIDIETAGDVLISCGGSIDVSGEGYWEGQSYPGADLPSWNGSGGSHVGEGGLSGGTPGQTFGSVYRPHERGAGGMGRGSGGGVVRISAIRVTLGGPIRANGTDWGWNQAGGAGGSVWIDADNIAGVSFIQAAGASSSNSGGGGAIALEYLSIEPGLLESLYVNAGYTGNRGGAGAIYLFGPDSIYGDLVVDNGWINSGWTVLPALGGGTAGVGSDASTLVTGRDQPIPPFFEGHWVEIRHGEVAKGIWRIEAIDDRTLTLENGANVFEGDLWRGVYRFDNVTVRGNAKLYVPDVDYFGSVVVEPGSVLELRNAEAPFADLSMLGVVATAGQFRVQGAAGSLSDPDGIASARVHNETSGQSSGVNIQNDGSFSTIIAGSVGDAISLQLVDDHPRDPRDSLTELGLLPGNASAPVVDADLIQFVAKEISLGHMDRFLDGTIGAVTDTNQPVQVTATNLATGFVRQTTAAAGGNFSMTVRGTAGDPYELTVTDSHPQPLSTVLDLGPLPDLMDPVIWPGLITVSTADRLYWLSSQEPAFWDDGEIVEAYAHDLSHPEVQYPLEIRDDFTLAPSPLPIEPGAIPRIVVVDGVGNSRIAHLDAMPLNEGPPTLRLENISTSIASGDYVVEGTGWCDWIIEKTVKNNVVCQLPIESPDGISSVRVENRTTPAFAPIELSVIEECTGCFRFDPATVDGVVGDEIWMVVEDDHPHLGTAEAMIWALPTIPGAPFITFSPSQLGWMDGQYMIAIFENDITDPDEPLTFEVSVWRDDGSSWNNVFTHSRSMASGEAFLVALPGGQESDLVLVSATDAGGLTSTVRFGTLPAPVPVTFRFDDAFVFVDEQDEAVWLDLEVSREPLMPVNVWYRTVMGSALEGSDYIYSEGKVEFPAGSREDQGIFVEIVNDNVTEPNETFRVELFDPEGAEIGSPGEVVVTIEDDDIKTIVPYSVAVGAGNYLGEPIEVWLSGGVAGFAPPLPSIVGRGDRLEIEGLGSVFIDHCFDDTTCRVVDRFGETPMDAFGVQVLELTAAFGSLAEAVDGAADAEHLGSYDLVGLNRSLELVCYGSTEDTTPVVIDDWITSADNSIRIVAAEASLGHDGSWRHPGRWSGGAYRIEVDGQECIRTTVGNVNIEGVQFLCTAPPEVPVAAIHIDGVDGTVEVSEALIHLSGLEATAERVAVKATSGTAADVVVRNSAIWDVGHTEDHTGILVGDPGVSLLALNNTVFNAGYGIRNLGGTAEVTNNLVAGTSIASYEGEFGVFSTRNLAADATAPSPPDNAFGPVVVANPGVSYDADFHLGCGVLDQQVTITHDFEVGTDDDLILVFDGNPETLLRSNAINPANLRLEFNQQRAIMGTSVDLSHHDLHEWMVAAADSVEDLENQTGSYRELVPWRQVQNEHRIWDGVSFDSAETFQVIELSVQRIGGDDYVHIAEWTLDSLNPACSQGLDLSSIGPHRIARDFDSVGRIGPWDIGADHSNDLEVGFAEGPWAWYEEEETALLQVMLSEPVTEVVTVRYRTEPGSADPGSDYEPVEGELVFEVGDVSRIIVVPLENDGPTEEGIDDFNVILFDASGARMGDFEENIEIHEGTPPARVTLSREFYEFSEFEEIAEFDIWLNMPLDHDVYGDGNVDDHSAHIGADYRGPGGGAPWAGFYFPPGETDTFFEFELVDDDVEEGVEGFRVKLGWVDGADRGVPAVAYVRIHDDDEAAP